MNKQNVNEFNENFNKDVNPNGSLLNPTVISICTVCGEWDDRVLAKCPKCLEEGSIETIREDDAY